MKPNKTMNLNWIANQISLRRNEFEKLLIKSLNSAAKEQDLCGIRDQLIKIAPDIKEQYTSFNVDTEFLEVKVRTQHAFQIKLALKALQGTEKCNDISVVDIGDSSGTHLKYLSKLIRVSYPKIKNVNVLGVNIDTKAVEKIRSRGIQAIECRAEDLLKKHKLKADIFLSFETLEHLYDPIAFLNEISRNDVTDCMVLTVPYLKRSRVGLHHIRNNRNINVNPENTHIYELSPIDWKLIFKHAGWRIEYDSIYRQYPLKSMYYMTKEYWKRKDFEGFYGAVLKRDRTWAERYRM